ncbi:phosphotransferase [Candidatus Dojkabacteria bacterium]|nr:phosphotransferase [Candidatus Dojkabacteria bacterium]
MTTLIPSPSVSTEDYERSYISKVKSEKDSTSAKDFKLAGSLKRYWGLKLIGDPVDPDGGLINDTSIVTAEDEESGVIKQYVVQFVNEKVFNPKALLCNAHNVRAHIFNKRLTSGLDKMKAREGLVWQRLTNKGNVVVLTNWLDKNGKIRKSCLRVNEYIPGICTKSFSDSSQCYVAGKLLAKFWEEASGVEEYLMDPLPGYYDFDKYYNDLQIILKNKRNKGDSSIEDFITNNFDRENLRWKLVKNSTSGVWHGDAKAANYVCNDNKIPIAIIDMDTVWKGPRALDVGAALRTAVEGCSEESAISNINVNIKNYRALLEGIRDTNPTEFSLENANQFYAGFVNQIFQHVIRFYTSNFKLYFSGDQGFALRASGNQMEYMKQVLAGEKEFLDINKDIV